MFVRSLQPIIESRFHQGKTILVLGPRQVGKTTLINACLANKNTLFLDGDDPHVQRVLHQAGFSELARLIGSFKWAGYSLLRVFGDRIKAIMGDDQTNRWVIDQVMEIDGPDLAKRLSKSFSNLVKGSSVDEPRDGFSP